MSTSAPIIDLSPQVRDAFDEGCRAVFKTHLQRPMVEYKSRDLLQRFAAHYQHLSALPRRMRRTLERRWKCTLSAIALLMTLGQAPAFAAIMQVAPNTPPAIKADGSARSSKRSSMPTAMHVLTSTVWRARALWTRSSCPQTANRYLTRSEMLPTITSPIVIEGNGGTIRTDTMTGI